jgi:nicotinate-nucleotide adenylyltransferase
VTAKSGRNHQPQTPSPPPFGDRRRVRIGLLGGSFNPAHEGHLHISEEAKRRLNLDQVWWLVSPQNPLKSAHGMAPLSKRLAGARALASRANIVATDIERRLGSTRTARTLSLLAQRYPAAQFVWLMGADNLAQMPRWWRWTAIFRAARVAVFDRSPYSYRALAGAAAQRFARDHVRRPLTIWFRSPPAWTYVAILRHPASATALRKAA